MKRGSVYFLADYSMAADPLGCCLRGHHDAVWFKLWAVHEPFTDDKYAQKIASSPGTQETRLIYETD